MLEIYWLEVSWSVLKTDKICSFNDIKSLNNRYEDQGHNIRPMHQRRTRGLLDRILPRQCLADINPCDFFWMKNMCTIFQKYSKKLPQILWGIKITTVQSYTVVNTVLRVFEFGRRRIIESKDMSQQSSEWEGKLDLFLIEKSNRQKHSSIVASFTKRCMIQFQKKNNQFLLLTWFEFVWSVLPIYTAMYMLADEIKVNSTEAR